MFLFLNMENKELFQTILENFKQKRFLDVNKKEVTFYDVAGFPHFENVMSNVLKFFFDTNEEHGFGDIWLRSLLEVYNEKSGANINISDLDTQDIQREYSNGNDKRIDLLIRSNSLIVVIENKIYVDASYNPLKKYNESAENYAKESNMREPIYVRIILSVFSQDRNDNGFINITYKELFSKLDPNISLMDNDNKWMVFAKDFIVNIKNRKEETSMELDKEWMKFVKDSGNGLGKLYKTLDESVEERVSILRAINDNLNNLPSTQKGVYNSKPESFISQFNDIHVEEDGCNVCIETYMMKYATNKDSEDYDKLYISLWCRRNRHYNFSKILEALNKKDAHWRETTGSGTWGEHYILDVYSLTDPINVEEISNKIGQYIKTIVALNTKTV